MPEIIDAHVHIGRYHLPIEEIDSLLKASGISRAVVFADPESNDMVNDSLYALEAARRMGYYAFYYYGGNAYSGQRPYDRLPVPDNLDQYNGIKWHCWFSPAHDGGLRYSYPINMDNVRRQMDAPDFQSVMNAIQALKFPMTFEEHFDVTCEFVRRYPMSRSSSLTWVCSTAARSACRATSAITPTSTSTPAWDRSTKTS